MARIARAVEGSQRYLSMPPPAFRQAESNFPNAVALAAVQAAQALGITRIVAFTETGNSVRLISRYRPAADVYALSPNPQTVNHMTVLAHVRPMLFRRERSLEDMLYMASEMLVVRGFAQYGDALVFVAGVPAGQKSSDQRDEDPPHRRRSEDALRPGRRARSARQGIEWQVLQAICWPFVRL